MDKERPVLAVPENSQVIRVIPDLALEIGLQRSLVLVQVAYWCARTKVFRDGRWWARCSLTWMAANAFRFWSIATIGRHISSLIEDGYLLEDATRSESEGRWLALNPDGLAQLQSVGVMWETGVSQNETGCLKMRQGVSKRYGVSQNEKNQESESKNQNQEVNQRSSNPATGDAGEGDDDNDLSLPTRLGLPENFQPLPDDLKPEIQEQLERLGVETARQVAQRCLDKKARTWRYLLTSLRNEPRDLASAVPDCAKWATPDDNPVGTPYLASALDDAPTPASCEPTPRAALIQSTWDAACAELLRDYGSLFEPVIRTLALVDYDPSRQEFAAVFHQPPGERNLDYTTAHGAIRQTLSHLMETRDIRLRFMPHFRWRPSSITPVGTAYMPSASDARTVLLPPDPPASDPEQVCHSFNELFLSGLTLEEIKQQRDPLAWQAAIARISSIKRDPL